MARRLSVSRRAYRAKSAFRIARGAKTHAEQLIVTIEEDGARGRGACVPYARYGESLDSAEETIRSLKTDLEAGLDRAGLAKALAAGAARNALDCALWDLEAKQSGEPVWRLADLPEPAPVPTCFTLSVDTPENVASASLAANAALLKMKLAGDGLDAERIAAASDAAPAAQFVLDANEGLDALGFETLLKTLDPARVRMIEQPLPANADTALAGVVSPIPVCADESFHYAADVARLADRYQAINIKLDKTGGLTDAIAAARAAEEAGLQIMIGCMLGSSLAMAPAALLAPLADVVDLDGPLLLAEDDDDPIPYAGAVMGAPPRALWG